jgi:hypothetical protein
MKTFSIALLLSTQNALAAEPFTGRWEHRGAKESGLWLDTEHTKNLVKFQLEISRGSPSYHSGWIQGEFTFKDGVGQFRKSTEDGVCEIRFQFKSEQVELKQNGGRLGCGFGNGVLAVGTLKRVNRVKPVFCKNDPREGKCE